MIWGETPLFLETPIYALYSGVFMGKLSLRIPREYGKSLYKPYKSLQHVGIYG